MWTHGIEVRNDNNNIQMSSDSVYLTPINRIYSTGKNTLKIAEPIHAISPKPGTLAIQFHPSKVSGTDPNGLPYKYIVIGEGSIINYRELTPSTSIDNYGINIYDASGVLRYNTSFPTMKILERVHIPDIRKTKTIVNGNTTYWSKSFPGKDVAFLPIRYSMYKDPTDGYPDRVYGVGLCRRGDVYSLEQGFATNYFGTWGATWETHFILIDVTGIV